jgi:parallel beta-helix repeat protein
MSLHNTVSSRLFAGLTALSLFASPVLAETFTVKPNGPLPTIQAGIDAANADDTVNVKAGTYFENVTIPAGKDGLRLMAKGKVTIDARPEGDAGTGPGLYIESDDVTVQGFTIRMASPGDGFTGPGIRTTGDRLTVIKSTFQHCEDGGIFAKSADGLRVIGSSFFACGGRAISSGGEDLFVDKCRIRQGAGGVYAEGSNAQVHGTTIESVDDIAIELLSEGARAIGNTIRISDGDGIFVNGEAAQVVKNKISGVSGAGIVIHGEGALVSKNTLEDVDGNAIELSGEAHEASGNRLSHIGARGISSSGFGAVIDRNTMDSLGSSGVVHGGSAFEITRNTIRDVYASDEGITVADSDTGLIAFNKLSDISRSGIQVHNGASQIRILKNKVDRAGDNGGDGILAEGNGHEISGNKISSAMRDGIHAEGEGLLISGNKVSGSGEDGIDLDSGDSNEIRDNRVTDCLAEGIENSASNTAIEGNTSKGNRTDFADDGSLASFDGNLSGDDTDATAGKPAIDS